MTLLTMAVFLGIVQLEQMGIVVWQFSLAVFVIMWIAQFVGHHVEGSAVFLTDLRFLLVGPAWWWALAKAFEYSLLTSIWCDLPPMGELLYGALASSHSPCRVLPTHTIPIVANLQTFPSYSLPAWLYILALVSDNYLSPKRK